MYKVSLLRYSNLYVPLPFYSTNGNKYLMIFVYGYNRICRVYLIKKKDEAYEIFKKVHLWIQNEAQSHISTLHTNNGKEYTSNEI